MANNPPLVEGALQLTQALNGPITTDSYKSRGYYKTRTKNPYGSRHGPPVMVRYRPLPISSPLFCLGVPCLLTWQGYTIGTRCQLRSACAPGL